MRQLKHKGKIKLFDADTLEYEGSIIVNKNQWQFENVKNENLKKMTSGMPIKAVLACLISFNLVYDIVEERE